MSDTGYTPLLTRVVEFLDISRHGFNVVLEPSGGGWRRTRRTSRGYPGTPRGSGNAHRTPPVHRGKSVKVVGIQGAGSGSAVM